MITITRAIVVRIFIAVTGVLLCATTVAAQTETVEYYGLDALGSVRIVFDASGNVTGRMDYGPFGESLVTGSGMPSRAYAGLFRDGEAGLDFAEARSYQSRTGRFSTTDAVYAGLFEPQRWNRYAYALNSPLERIDPTGNADCPVGSYWCPGSTTGPAPIDIGLRETVTVRASTSGSNASAPSGFSLATAIGFALASIATQPSAIPGYKVDWGQILSTRTAPGIVISAIGDLISADSSLTERGKAAVSLALIVAPATRSLKAAEEASAGEAFHYTFSRLLTSIEQNGLRPGTYATLDGGLSPFQAQIDLALRPNRGLTDVVVRIDLAGMRQAGYQVPSVSQVGRSFGMPGGGTEMRFPYPVPPQFISLIRR